MTTHITQLPAQGNPSNSLRGYVFAFATVLIWSCYFLSLRIGALSPMTSTDLGLLRFAVPAVLLLPWFVSGMSGYKQVPLRYLVGIVLGGGLPFFLLSATAMANTSVMAGSTLIPGAAPVFVSIIALTCFQQRLSKARVIGLAFIVLGLTVFLVYQGLHSAPYGLSPYLILLLCAALWAIFTVSVRLSALKAINVAALAAVPNGLAIALWSTVNGQPMSFVQLPINELLGQLAVQSMAVGVGSGLLYSMAIRYLGAESTSSVGSLTPVVASLLAFFILQEALDTVPLIGLTLTAAGVTIASRPS